MVAGLVGLLAAACAPSAAPAASTVVPVAGGAASAPVVSGSAAPAPQASVSPAAPASPSTQPASSGASVHLKIAYPSISLSWFPLYLADKQGFLADAGISIETASITPAAQIAAVAAGEEDYSTAFGSAVEAAARGLPLITLMAICSRPQHVLEAAPDIQRVEDLKDKAVGVSSLGSTTQREVITVLQAHGMSESDVTFVSLDNTTNEAAALEAGRVAAAPLTVPENIESESRGTHPLVNIADVVNAPLAGLSTSKAHLAAHPDEAVRMVGAVLRAVKFAKANKAETVQQIAQFNSIDAATASAAYDLVIDTWSDDGIVSDDAIRNTFTDQQQAADANIADLVDWSYARRAAAVS